MEKYELSKKRIVEILSSKTIVEKTDTIPENDKEFTYENGIRSWVTSVFVDIRNSTQYFKEKFQSDDVKARVLRAFTSEIVNILSSTNLYREIGIRGDCVYGIFSTPKQKDIKDIISLVAEINSFNNMLQKILTDFRIETFKIGIGIGCGEDLIIKAGKYNTGISDKIWLGSAVVDASNLSSWGNKTNGYGTLLPTILISSCVFHNIKDFNANEQNTYSDLFREYSIPELGQHYGCNLVNTEWNNWNEKGMK